MLGFFTKRRKNQIEDIGPKIFACIKWEGQHVGHKALEGFVLSTAFPLGSSSRTNHAYLCEPNELIYG